MSSCTVTFEKPVPHIGLSDWYSKQWELQKVTDTRRADGFDLRNLSRFARAETLAKTEWDTYKNNARLGDRIAEVSHWRDILQQLLEKLLLEARLLDATKRDIANELEWLSQPLQVIALCISMRDCRRGTELTYDEPDTELKKELCFLENIRRLLTERAQATWEKANRLHELRCKIQSDIQNKAEAIKIDEVNLSLDRTSANITLKPNALITTKNSLTYDAWLTHCRNAKALADTELSDVFNFREGVTTLKEHARSDFKTQQDMTDYSLRKRIYQTQKAKNELEWQKLKVQKEMDILQKEIIRLDDALAHKINAIKCVETRLENRRYRPGFELCSDQVESGLKIEVQQLRQTEKELTNTNNNAKAAYNGLESLLKRLDINLEDKQHSLATDTMCLNMMVVLTSSDKTE